MDFVKFRTPIFFSLFRVLVKGLAVFMKFFERKDVPTAEVSFLGVKLNFVAIFFEVAAAG